MKQSNQKVVLEINASPEDAWKVIGAVDGVEKWFAPVITACRVDGQNRYCSTEEGDFTEDLLKVDHENRLFKYGIPQQPIMPVENIIGSMSVNEASNGNAEVTWEWTFEVSESDEAQIKEMFAGMGQMGIKGIESLINAN